MRLQFAREIGSERLFLWSGGLPRTSNARPTAGLLMVKLIVDRKTTIKEAASSGVLGKYIPAAVKSRTTDLQTGRFVGKYYHGWNSPWLKVLCPVKRRVTQGLILVREVCFPNYTPYDHQRSPSLRRAARRYFQYSAVCSEAADPSHLYTKSIWRERLLTFRLKRVPYFPGSPGMTSGFSTPHYWSCQITQSSCTRNGISTKLP